MDDMEEMGGQGEQCYRPGCDGWVTGASDYCSPECDPRAIPEELAATAQVVVDAMDRLNEAARDALEAYAAYRQRVMKGLGQ